MIFEGVPRTDAALVWPECWRWLEPALTRFPGSPESPELFMSVRRGERQLWIAWDEARNVIAAAVITEIVRYQGSSALICRVPWVGGRDMRKWLPEALAMLKAWAIDMGCRFMEGSGRRGWKRFGFVERGLSPETGLPILVLDLAEA
jgi:hypothetical protein